ncbi:gamma interferon inducible lysosomal thiol reductase (GILT) domain-containing protein [Ditylenchus destructor]|uniref:Gamma interferon inducible lysosomal thiol reductase (GILT) domain-containing protein n=1 Tax=Ditylenchus destructor TaxID=166010 RepID=A0AAD4QXI2_9BILA|nr:gamma interferon inducible lysosomal thiol reductase (GILT) domain-containing protein [Ditylenchus destructor]
MSGLRRLLGLFLFIQLGHFQQISANRQPNAPSTHYQTRNYPTQHQSSSSSYYTTHAQHTQRQPSPPPTTTTLAPSPSCTVPSDFWCDSHELAERCNVLAQCENLRRDRRPLTVTIMFEALCPFCQRFITNHLGNLYHQFKDQINIELVPWGNSILLRNGQISCNHGPKECDANRLMGCALAEVTTEQAIPFIVCFERQLSAHHTVDSALHHCSGFIRNNFRQIKHCYTGERGAQLQRQAAYRTMNAKANQIVEVPYILINNYSPNVDANAINIMTLPRLLQKWINLRRR